MRNLGSQIPFFTFYIATVIAAALVVGLTLRASWGMFLKGVIWVVLADQVGAFIGSFGVRMLAPRSTSLVVAYIPYLLGTVTEELGRCRALYRYTGRQEKLADIIMFGVGFGGFEVVYHGIYLIWAGTALDYQTTILMIEMYGFHVALSIIIFTYIRQAVVTTVGLALIYHVGLNICAFMALQHSRVHAILIWSIASAIHWPLALRATRISVTPEASAISH